MNLIVGDMIFFISSYSWFFLYIKKYKRNSFLLSFLPKTSVVKHKKMVFFKDLRIKQFGFYFNN